MSFQFMPLYTGDYLRDTQHLSCSEHGIYIKFLMHCWDQKGPVPPDERKQVGICNARSGDEIEAMRRVLREFFAAMDDGWYNKRMAEEISKAEGLSAARSKGGQISAANRARTKSRSASSTQVELKLNTSSTLVGTPTPRPTPKTTTTNTPLPPLKGGDGSKPFREIPDWLDAEGWESFVAFREEKKSPLSDRAVTLAFSKLDDLRKSGNDPVKVIEQSILNGWKGLFQLPVQRLSEEEKARIAEEKMWRNTL